MLSATLRCNLFSLSIFSHNFSTVMFNKYLSASMKWIIVNMLQENCTVLKLAIKISRTPTVNTLYLSVLAAFKSINSHSTSNAILSNLLPADSENQLGTVWNLYVHNIFEHNYFPILENWIGATFKILLGVKQIIAKELLWKHTVSFHFFHFILKTVWKVSPSPQSHHFIYFLSY